MSAQTTMTAAHQYGTKDFDWFWYGLAIVLPITAVFIAIRWFAIDRIGPGLAVLLTGWVAASVWVAVLFAAGVANL